MISSNYWQKKATLQVVQYITGPAKINEHLVAQIVLSRTRISFLVGVLYFLLGRLSRNRGSKLSA